MKKSLGHVESGGGVRKGTEGVYREELDNIIESGGKVLMFDVRRKMKKVNSLFPDLTAQIRDKLFTISSQVRRRRIGEGKGKGKGRKEEIDASE